jgi:hypothetical protein
MTLVLTGSINLTSGGITTDRDGVYSGSFSGSLVGDGSGLTGITGGGGGSSDFPYTGSAIISGSLEVDGITEVISGSIIGDGSGLTDVQIFPFEGQADIIGGFKLDGEFEFNYLSSSNDAWSTAASLNIARSAGGGAGIQNAALVYGGIAQSPHPIERVPCTEQYNGSSWNQVSPLNLGITSNTGAGTQNAALSIGGFAGPPYITPNTIAVTCTEEYNGSTWSFGGDMNRPARDVGTSGTQNAALAFGGSCFTSPTTTYYSCTENYNGTSWSSGVDLNTARSNLTGTGTQNAALAIGGYNAPSTKCETEEFNGSTWSFGGNLPFNASYHSSVGIQNASLFFGAAPTSIQSCTLEYNGFTWSSKAALNTGRENGTSAGTATSALYIGGSVYGNCTEEYNADACYRKHFYSQQNTVYSNQLYVTGSTTADALLNLANRDTTPDPLTEGMIWQSGSANSGCLYFSPDGTSICKISFA